MPKSAWPNSPADKQLRELFDQKIIGLETAWSEAYPLRDAFKNVKETLFRRHYYNVRNEYKKKFDQNAGLKAPTSKCVLLNQKKSTPSH